MKSFRSMRLIVLFDIPVKPESSKKQYTRFRKYLLNNGYDMLQYSVYTRFCRNDTDAKKHMNRVKKNSPCVGNIRVIKVTDNQYENMIVLSGKKSGQEEIVKASSLVVID